MRKSDQKDGRKRQVRQCAGLCRHLDDGQNRTRLWMRAVNAGAAQLACNVYWNPREVLEIQGVDPDEDTDDDSDSPLPNPCVR